MKQKKKGFLIIAALMLAAVIAAGLWYARPLTIEELCPGLELEECTGVYAGYSSYDNKGLYNRIALTPEDDLTDLLELFQGRQFRRSPLWWIPRGTRTHPIVQGDFQWSIDLAFEDITLPDGSFGSGYVLHFNNFYGKLDLGLDGTTWPVRTADQKQWLKDVLAYILEAEAKIESK